MRLPIDPNIRGRMPSVWCYGWGLWLAAWVSFGDPAWLPSLSSHSAGSPWAPLASYVPVAFAYLLMSSLRRRLAPLHKQRALLVGAALVMSTGIVLLGLAEVRHMGTVWTIVGLSLIGTGTAPGILAWYELFCAIGVRKAAISVVVSQLMAAGVYLFDDSVGRAVPLVATTALACLPVLSLRALLGAWKDPGTQPLNPAVQQKPFRLPAAILAGMFVYGAIFGFMLSLTTLSASSDFSTPGLTRTLSEGGVAFALLLYSVFSRHFSLGRIHQPVLPLLVAGFLLLPLAQNMNPFVASAIVLAGYAYFAMFSVTIYSQIAGSLPAPALAVAGWGLFADACGVTVGNLANVVLVGTSGATLAPVQLSAISCVAVGAVVLTSTFLLNERAVTTLWGLVTLEPREDVLEKRCAETSTTYGLTPRESEILMMLARGRDAEQIRRTLVLSMPTVRTHIHRIHEKIGVHSRRELMDVVESGTTGGNGSRVRPG